MTNFLIVAVLVGVSTFLVHTGLNSIGLLPQQASVQAVEVDKLFNLLLWLISFLFSLIVVILSFSLVVFRRKKGETGDGAYIVGDSRLEVAWTLVPLFAVIFLAYIGAQSLGETRRIDNTALQINVTAGQWYWHYQYPDSGVSSNELYLPVGRQADLLMTSNDVIHSFWVPEFRIKQDLVPGRTTELRITPTTIGNFKVRCAELCGASHAYMEGAVNVVSEQDFEKWVSTQQASTTIDPVARGQKLVQQYGCEICHSLDGSVKTGPTWARLAGSDVKLSDWRTVEADHDYLVESIINPDAKIVAGFSSNVMPKFGDILDQTMVEAIVVYIQSLK